MIEGVRQRHCRLVTGVVGLALFAALASPDPVKAAIPAPAGTSGSFVIDCGGTPPDAAMTLPPPLDRWGGLVCTVYGHVITAKEGWVWTRPAALSPVYVPAQMVRANPAPLGNQSYFTSIKVSAVSDEAERQIPFRALEKIFPADPSPPQTFRLDVTSNSGRSLRLYFLDFEEGPWGLWCAAGEECDPASAFMILDTGPARGTSPPNIMSPR